MASNTDSEWEVIEAPKPAMQPQQQSDWEVVQQPAGVKLPTPENMVEAIGRAPTRIGEDIYNAAWQGLRSIPGYANAGVTEIPGLYNTMREHPGRLGQQGLAGLAELGNKAFNFPHDVANYASERLHLLPQDINKKIQMGRMPADTQELINQQFGQPKYPGEALVRGAIRNIPEIVGAKGITSLLNPLNLTNKGIARNVVRAGEKEMQKSVGQYNKVFNSAERQGINNVPVNHDLVNSHLSIIDHFKTPKQTYGIKHFLEEPTLKNAQMAQKDLGKMERSLEAKAETESLTEPEKALYQAVTETRDHIHQNMFRDAQGNVHQGLLDRYNAARQNYARNVVPYRYNAAIRDYIGNNITAKELVSRISGGEFRAKKGYKHPALFIRENWPWLALSAGGSLGYGKLLSDKLLGTHQEE